MSKVYAYIAWLYTNIQLPPNLRIPKIREHWELIKSNHHNLINTECIQSGASVIKTSEPDDEESFIVPDGGFVTRQSFNV